MYYPAGYDTTLVTSAIPFHRLGDPSNSGFPIDPSGIAFHAASRAGVLISKPGKHVVGLYDLSGGKIREERSMTSPIDYDFGADLAGRHGVFVIRVAVPGATRSR